MIVGRDKVIWMLLSPSTSPDAYDGPGGVMGLTGWNGGSALFENSEFQRYWRDVNAAAAHRGLTWDWVAVGWTKTMIGVPVVPGFTFTRA